MSQWNTLSVPLEDGWQCTLVPAGDYRSPSDEWLVFVKGDEREQIKRDRRDFDRYFRPRSDLRTVSGGAELREIQSFVHDTLNVAHWNRPTDNASVEHMLREAVANGWLVPVVNRDWRSLGRASRPTPAPLRWPSGGGGFGGGGQKWAVFAGAGSGPLFFNGEPVLSGPYDPATQEARLSAARSAMAANDGGGDGGFDLLGAVGAVAGAVLGDDAGDLATTDLVDADTSTPLGDAQPFEYTPGTLGGDIEEVAARGVRMTGNEPGGYRINPNGLDVDYFDSNGNLCAQYHGSHGEAHGHNFDAGVRDGTHLPMSPINCR